MEPNETFTVTLSSPSGATLADGVGLGTITNDDTAPLPTLSIGDVAVAEGNSGTSAATFTVTLSAASTSTVTVAYATANGTATAGSDYVAQSGTLTFTAGQTAKTIAVVVNGDTTVEPSETFTVTLSSPSGATLADGVGLGTITNDDTAPLPTLSTGDVAVAEGNSGTGAATFTVTLSAASTSTVTVAYATANGTATAGSDYVAQSGTLTFTAGQTSKTIAVVVNGDTTVEPNETFTVTLSSPSGATLADGVGLGTITNDDSATRPSLSINDVTLVEGNSGTRLAVFTVTLSGVSTSAVSVAYSTANGTARAGNDYVAQSGTLTFAAGQTTRTIGVVVKGDRNTEPSETFSVLLSGAVGATIARGAGTGTIANDDFRGRAVRQGWW
ncbi:MAG: Calx-beta domain-containing protein [Vicinamibacteria bacterium]